MTAPGLHVSLRLCLLWVRCPTIAPVTLGLMALCAGEASVVPLLVGLAVRSVLSGAWHFTSLVVLALGMLVLLSTLGTLCLVAVIVPTTTTTLSMLLALCTLRRQSASTDAIPLISRELLIPATSTLWASCRRNIPTRPLSMVSTILHETPFTSASPSLAACAFHTYTTGSSRNFLLTRLGRLAATLELLSCFGVPTQRWAPSQWMWLMLLLWMQLLRWRMLCGSSWLWPGTLRVASEKDLVRDKRRRASFGQLTTLLSISLQEG